MVAAGGWQRRRRRREREKAKTETVQMGVAVRAVDVNGREMAEGKMDLAKRRGHETSGR